MNSPDVAAALYAGAPDAAGKLYDAHAEALFQYCWLTLRDRWQAKTAVCDALVQAGARVAELSDPATLRAWLFALVRAECHHHPLPSLGDTDEPIARPEQPDATLRIMAWNSVMSLDLVQRQALDLATRHGMTEAEIGLILGLPLPGTTELLATARAGLERALGAEILVSRDSLECPGRTEAIRGWTGTVTPEFRDRLLAHAGACEVCRPRLPGNVSPGRIFGLLPAPALDGAARSWVISRVGELIRSQAAEPAPVEVATPEMALLPPVPPEESHEPPVQAPAQAGAPKPKPTPEPEPQPQPQSKPAAARPAPKPQPRAQPAPAAPRPAPRRRRLAPRILAGVAAALAAAGIAAGLAVGSTGGHTRLSGSDSRLATGPAAPAQAGMGQPDPGPDAPPARPGRGRRSPAAGATTSPAAGGADAVTSGKQAGAGARGGTRAGGQGGQTTRRTVTVAVAPRTQAGGPGAPASTQAAARLTVSPASLVLDQGSSGDLTLTASGGPVSWSAGATSGSVGFSPASGQLGNGDSATVTVTVTRSGANGGSATVSINGAQVSVSWSARPAASAPSGSSGSTGASGSAGSGPGSAGASPPAGRRHHRPNAGGSPAPAGS